VRTTPIALLARRHVSFWTALAAKADTAEPSPRAQEVVLFLQAQGASFFDEMVAGSGLLRSQLETALAELVALGLVTCDSFAGLRALLVPSDRRQPFAGARRRRRTVAYGMEGAGRWSLVRRVPLPKSSNEDTPAVEHLARTLLRRYGVVFWRLLEREAAWLPPWRDLLRVYRKLERRGEIRGGRFVAGFSGEQFALPDAVGALREARRKPKCNALVSVSGADPLNLVGILTPGPRLPALTSNRMLYRDGVPVALLAGGEVTFLEALDPAMEWQARIALLRSAMPAQLARQIA
jgi:ATP-dependent Lhr-like helicase